MQRVKVGLSAIPIILIIVWLAIPFSRAIAARDLQETTPPSGPDRFAPVMVKFTSYRWWLVKWNTNKIECEVFVEHEGLPTSGEIYTGCGEDLHKAWKATKPCPETTLSACTGYYLHYVGSAPAEKQIGVSLPPPVVWVSVSGCDLRAPSNLCPSLPTLLLIGEEPLLDERITGIHGFFGGTPFICTGGTCEIPLTETTSFGVIIEFWAFSSYGDTSGKFQARIRVVPSAEPNPDEREWVVDVLSTQWLGDPPVSCSQNWEAFSPAAGLPGWLNTPRDVSRMSSNIPYSYLAGNLIQKGAVDASLCPDGGLLPGGGANNCGMGLARGAVNDWQNRFDTLILATARKTGIPAQLLKNLFSQESQFWPASPGKLDDIGLGQLTEDGADSTLLWNPEFYNQFCSQVLDSTVCQAGYLRLSDANQALLRGALLSSINAACDDCPLGIDVLRADYSVEVFAHTLEANCRQTGQIVRNITGDAPGNDVTYENMWKFTLVNYNAGPGCLFTALQTTFRVRNPLDWDHISANLEPACQGAVDYVNFISR